MQLREYIRKRAAGKIALIVTFIFSAPFIYMGFLTAQQKMDFLRNSIPVTGIVLRNEPLPNVKQSYNLAPVIEFTAKDGEIITYQDKIATYPPEFSIGDQVNVLYDKDDPHNATISSFTQMWLMTLILTGSGILIILAGYIIIRVLAHSIEEPDDTSELFTTPQ